MGVIFLVTGPSGIGKTFLAEDLLHDYSELFKGVPVVTTRTPRPGEQSGSDRTFVSEDEFLTLQKHGDFLVADRFHGHWYGWLKEDLSTPTSNLIVNIWPALIPRFSSMQNALIVALTTTSAGQELLRERMLRRGDGEEKVAERMHIVKKDIDDIENHKALIQKHGSIFTVIDDSTIPNEVKPWMLEKLQA